MLPRLGPQAMHKFVNAKFSRPSLLASQMVKQQHWITHIFHVCDKRLGWFFSCYVLFVLYAYKQEGIQDLYAIIPWLPGI